MPWLTDPDDPRVIEAKRHTCDVCKAPKTCDCTNICRPGEPLPGRIVHLERTGPFPRQTRKGDE